MSERSAGHPKVNPLWIPVCSQALAALVDRIPDILGAVITTGDGFEIASYVPNPDMSPKKLSAMTSSMLGLADALVAETKLARSNDVIIDADKGQVLLLSIPATRGQALLSVIANKKVLIGELLWACRQSCTDMATRLDSL